MTTDDTGRSSAAASLMEAGSGDENGSILPTLGIDVVLELLPGLLERGVPIRDAVMVLQEVPNQERPKKTREFLRVLLECGASAGVWSELLVCYEGREEYAAISALMGVMCRNERPKKFVRRRSSPPHGVPAV